MPDIYGFQYGTQPYGSETTDDGAPFAIDLSPAKDEEDVDRDTLVRFSMPLDIVDPWTVEVDHGSGFELALTYNVGAVFEAEYAGAGSIVTIGSRIVVVIDKVDLFDPFDQVTIRILAQDTNGYPIEIA